MKQKLLIVEDQFVEANNLKLILTAEGYQVCSVASSVHAALAVIEKETPDLVLVDIFLQGELTGIDLAHRLREKKIAFIFISANSDKQVLEAAKLTEPYGFLVKPIRKKDVLVMLNIAWYLHQCRQSPVISKTPRIRSDVRPPVELSSVIGTSVAMQETLHAIKIVGPSDISVLLLGESGTGKELAAQCIHNISARHKNPFIVVNCAALPANLIESELFGHEKGAFTGAIDKRTGKFEQAHGGTIFLDEIGELPVDLQAKLLRVLQEREIEPIGGYKRKIDVRFIAATNRDLEEEVATGRFRMDLYYRLSVFPVRLPSLRERNGDILLLADHFIKKYAQTENKFIEGMTEEVKRNLANYPWPGNVRQLENIMYRCVLLTNGKYITEVQLPDRRNSVALSMPPSVKTIHENERDYIVSALEQCQWKLYGPGGAAELLAINASTLSSRMKKLGIEKKKA